MGVDRLARPVEIEIDGAVRVGAGLQTPEDELGIRDGRPGAAAPETGRPGTGARALWTHREEARLRACDRAAACADRVDVGGRRVRVVAVDLEIVLQRDFPARHQGHVAARPADLHRDQVAVAQDRTAIFQSAHRRGRAGEEERRRGLGHLIDRQGSAIALQHEQGPSQAHGLQCRGERAEIRDRLRSDIAIDDRRGASLVFAHLRRSRGGHRDPGVRPLGRDDLGGFALVPRVEVAVDEADRDRLHVGLPERLDGASDGIPIQRGDLRAMPVDPPRDADPQRARDEHRGHRRAMVPLAAPNAPADLQAVPKPLGRQQTDRRALLLQQHIGCNRRAVDEQRALAEKSFDPHAQSIGSLGEDVTHAETLVIGNRRDLEDADVAILPRQHHVGERTADIDPDAPRRSDWPIVDHDRQCPLYPSGRQSKARRGWAGPEELRPDRERAVL